MKFLFLFVAFLTPVLAVDSVQAESDAVLITELSTRGTFTNDDGEIENDHYIEFVELYNQSDEPIDITTWKLEYLTYDGDPEDEWSDKLLSNQDGERIIPPRSFYLIATNNFFDKKPEYQDKVNLRLNSGSRQAGGHIRLVNQKGESVDLVGWGDAEHAPGAGSTAPAPEYGESIHRCFKDGALVNTSDNAHDFEISNAPRPGSEFLCPEENGGNDNQDDDSEPPGDSDNEPDPTPESIEACGHVRISELLPNPEGPRSQYPREEHAYVELYNPEPETIDISGCGLQAESGGGQLTDIHWFDDVTLEPEEYQAFYQQETGVPLPVSPSGTVYILNTGEVEEYIATYPKDMPEAAAWAWFGNDTWEKTYRPTPGEHNQEQASRPCPDGQYRHPETNHCRNIDNAERELVPCEPHQERNPETNRCRNRNGGRSLVPCEDHQYRHPETNRCRNLDSGRDLVPCEPHQERNPETNRCRNINSNSDLVPCEDHQYRHPETNRCRNKVIDNDDAIKGVDDVTVVATGTPTSWWFIGFVLIFAAGYAIWEWRFDIRNFLRRSGKSPPRV